MAKNTLQNVGGINLKIRLTSPTFLVRSAIGILIPALTYLGLNWEDILSSWSAVWESIKTVGSSPAALGIILLNLLNLVPDSTHNNIRDTKYILNRESPNVSRNVAPVEQQAEDSPFVDNSVKTDPKQFPQDVEYDYPTEEAQIPKAPVEEKYPEAQESDESEPKSKE